MVDAGVAPGVRVLRVPDGPAGRVDRYVADATGLSRSFVQKLISDGRLTADGEALRANTVVTAGTELRLDVPPPTPLDLAPAPDIPLRIVYEDADLLIVDKPAGLVVHPAPGRGRAYRGADRPESEASDEDGGRGRRAAIGDRLPGPRAVRCLDVARAGSRHRADAPDPCPSRRDRPSRCGRPRVWDGHVAT